jgi:3-methylcrotonyl-CoA carboxylase alpha subunit
MLVGLRHNQRHLVLDVRREGDRFQVSANSVEQTVRAEFLDERTLVLELGGRRHRVDVVRDGTSLHVAVGGCAFTFTEERAAASNQHVGNIATPEIVAPMPGKVVRVLVKAGDRVAGGDTLFILEAMKMENRLVADAPALVETVNVNDGDLVDGGQVLAVLLYIGDDEAPTTSA